MIPSSVDGSSRLFISTYIHFSLCHNFCNTPEKNYLISITSAKLENGISLFFDDADTALRPVDDPGRFSFLPARESLVSISDNSRWVRKLSRQKPTVDDNEIMNPGIYNSFFQHWFCLTSSERDYCYEESRRWRSRSDTNFDYNSVRYDGIYVCDAGSCGVRKPGAARGKIRLQFV